MDFCYGSCDGMLWPVVDRIFNLGLRYDNSEEAVVQRKQFLIAQNLGICDIVASCWRSKIDSSDLGMQRIKLRDILMQLRVHRNVQGLIFTGKNSKNGPEYLFRNQLREAGMKLTRVDDTSLRRHVFDYDRRKVTTVSLISPSNAANRSIGGSKLYKKRRAQHPGYSTFDFRVEQYRDVFLADR